MTQPAAIARAIAGNLRRLRLGRGWSLETLAARSGVSRGMLIQLEQARTNPSVATLVRVADALGVSVAHLVDTAEVPAVRVVRSGDAVPLWRSGDTGVGTLLVGTASPPVVELWDWRLGPGDRYAAEAHVAGTSELLYVLEGELSVTVDGTAYRLTSGDAIAFRADREHTYACTGPAPARFVMAVGVPGSGDGR